MIVILKRDDLPPEHRERAMEALELSHTGLSSELVEQAELIVFVEGSTLKYLKQPPDIESKESIDMLVNDIIGVPAKVQPQWSIPRLGKRGKR